MSSTVAHARTVTVRSWFVAMVAVFALAAGLLTAAPANAASTGSISGTITVPDEYDLPPGALSVYAYSTYPGYDRSAVVADDGTYTLSGLPAGTYRLYFGGWGTELASEWWSDATTYSSAQPVTLSDGQARAGFDAELEYAATVSGTVTYPDGAHVDWAYVYVYPVGNPTEHVGQDSVADDGTYTVTNLKAGDYIVEFAVTGEVARQWWQDVPDWSGAQTLTLTADEDRTGVDATMSSGSSVTGTVVGGYIAAGWGYVQALRQSPDDTWEWEQSASIATDGTYTVRGLREGTYTLAFTDEDGFGWDDEGNTYTAWWEWWDDKVDLASATRLVVADDETLTGIDVDLDTVGGVLSWPSISGTARLGSTLTANPGVWPSGTPLAYEWYADDTYLEGVTGNTLTLTAAHVGKAIRVSVWGEKNPTEWEGKQSAQTVKVAPGTLTAPTPTISGTLAYGSTLTAKPGTWTSGTTLKYQWYANGAAISGATKSTLKLYAAQKGTQISVKVIGSKTGYTTASRTSVKTVKVATTATPTISGTLAYGSTLTAKPGTWTSRTTFTYQWHANGVKIAGATKPTLRLYAAQKGKQISVTVTGKLSGYQTIATSSATSSKVATVATPTISGTAKVGTKLTAKPGTWTSGTTFAYQWYASGKAISTATKSTFTLTSAQRGKTITVRVTGKKSGYATVAKTSKATAKVV